MYVISLCVQNVFYLFSICVYEEKSFKMTDKSVTCLVKPGSLCHYKPMPLASVAMSGREWYKAYVTCMSSQANQRFVPSLCHQFGQAKYINACIQTTHKTHFPFQQHTSEINLMKHGQS